MNWITRGIRGAGIGSVLRPNTAFPDSEGPCIGRWKSVLSPGISGRLEEMIAPILRELGYPPELVENGLIPSLASQQMHAAYHLLFHARKWLKQRSPFNRLVRLNSLRPGFLSSGGSGSPERSVESARKIG